MNAMKEVGRGHFNEARTDIFRKFTFLEIGIWFYFETYNKAAFVAAHYRYLKTNRLNYNLSLNRSKIRNGG